MKRISNEKYELVRSMILHGWFGYQIAEQVNVSEAYVNKVRKELKKEGHKVGYDR